MTVQLLVYVITTLFTYILGKISKHFGWNETLPIPIQNILIGIIATIIGCIIHIEGLDANSIIQAVVTGFLRILEENDDEFAIRKNNYIEFDTENLRNYEEEGEE